MISDAASRRNNIQQLLVAGVNPQWGCTHCTRKCALVVPKLRHRVFPGKRGLWMGNICAEFVQAFVCDKQAGERLHNEEGTPGFEPGTC